jgi:hypothetical protein
MLTNEKLGKAIEEALVQNGKKKADAARYFDVKPPSISGWVKTGRISKSNFEKLCAWLDKTPRSHWGLDEIHLCQDSKPRDVHDVATAIDTLRLALLSVDALTRAQAKPIIDALFADPEHGQELGARMAKTLEGHTVSGDKKKAA